MNDKLKPKNTSLKSGFVDYYIYNVEYYIRKSGFDHFNCHCFVYNTQSCLNPYYQTMLGQSAISHMTASVSIRSRCVRKYYSFRRNRILPTTVSKPQ